MAHRIHSRRSLLLLSFLFGVSAASSGSLFGDFDYSNATYWEERYRKSGPGVFEWYGLKWPILKAAVGEHLRPESRLLHLGTGSSALPEDMHRDGYRQQVGVDISTVVVDRMREKLGHLEPGLTFQVEDALNLTFQDASFDVVLEKGTLEAVGSDRDCSLADEGCEMVAAERALLIEAFRILRPGGLLLSVADELLPFSWLRSAGLERLEHVKIGEKDGLPMPKMVYLCFKGGVSDLGAGGEAAAARPEL